MWTSFKMKTLISIVFVLSVIFQMNIFVECKKNEDARTLNVDDGIDAQEMKELISGVLGRANDASSDADNVKWGPNVRCYNDVECKLHQRNGVVCYGLLDCRYCMCNPTIYRFLEYPIQAYYNLTERRCLPARRIGESCSHDQQCPAADEPNDADQESQDRYCDQNTNTCKCRPGYVPTAGGQGCEKPRLGQGFCLNATGCYSAITLTCDTLSERCVCASTYPQPLADATGCKKSTLNEACQRNEDCDDTRGLSCDLTASSPVCKCLGQALPSEDSANRGCRESNWDEACEVPTACTHALTCAGQSCACDPATGWRRRTSANLGQTGPAACEKYLVGQTGCGSDDNNCYDGGNTTLCIADRCMCKQTMPKPSPDKTHCKKIPVGFAGCESNLLPQDVQTYNGADNNVRCSDDPPSSGTNTTVCHQNTCKCRNEFPIEKNTYCWKAKIDQGCDGNSLTVSESGNDEDTACYDNPYGVCINGVCKCDPAGTRPIPQPDKQSCRAARYDESCNTDGCEGQLVCHVTGKCYCDVASFFYPETPTQQGDTHAEACRRATLNSQTERCISANHCQAYYHESGDQGVQCVQGVCRCAANRIQEGSDSNNHCRYAKIDEDCSEKECDPSYLACRNDTNGNQRCWCLMANNIYDHKLGNCVHIHAEYNVAEGLRCTHAHGDIEDTDGGWSVANHHDGLLQDNPVLRCGHNLQCEKCDENEHTYCRIAIGAQGKLHAGVAVLLPTIGLMQMLY